MTVICQETDLENQTDSSHQIDDHFAKTDHNPETEDHIVLVKDNPPQTDTHHINGIIVHRHQINLVNIKIMVDHIHQIKDTRIMATMEDNHHQEHK